MIARVGESPKRWLGDDTGAKWEPRDRLIMLGLGWYEAGLCPGCGDSLSVTTANDHGWRVHETQCLKCSALAIMAQTHVATDEANQGVPGAPIAEARRSWAEQIPLPPELQQT